MTNYLKLQLRQSRFLVFLMEPLKVQKPEENPGVPKNIVRIIVWIIVWRQQTLNNSFFDSQWRLSQRISCFSQGCMGQSIQEWTK